MSKNKLFTISAAPLWALILLAGAWTNGPSLAADTLPA